MTVLPIHKAACALPGTWAELALPGKGSRGPPAIAPAAAFLRTFHHFRLCGSRGNGERKQIWDGFRVAELGRAPTGASLSVVQDMVFLWLGLPQLWRDAGSCGVGLQMCEGEAFILTSLLCWRRVGLELVGEVVGFPWPAVGVLPFLLLGAMVGTQELLGCP